MAAMLYIFKSRNCADIIMLEPNGRRLLEIIGKEPAPQGIITPAQMPAAAQALKAAIAREDEAARKAQGAGGAQGETQGEARADGVTLRQRLLPMIEMLGRCEKAGRDITWGV
jgi:hypothetical protein